LTLFWFNFAHFGLIYSPFWRNFALFWRSFAHFGLILLYFWPNFALFWLNFALFGVILLYFGLSLLDFAHFGIFYSILA